MDAKRFAALAVLATLVAAFPASSGAASGPSADFTLDPLVALTGAPVTFTATALPAPGALISSYRWDLDGDGTFEQNTGLSPLVTTTYPLAGTYMVSLQMRDSWGNRVTKAHVLIVGGQPPDASFTIAPALPAAGQPVLFTSHSSDPDGVIVDESWDLDGNGVFDNGAGTTALRTFAGAGVYVVSLRATDNETHASFASQSLSVVPAPAFPAAPQLPRVAPAAALRLMSPFPVVRFSGSLTKRGARLRSVAVDAPTGSTVRVRCRGRGCPFGSRTQVISSRTGSLRLSRLQRRLRAGVQVRIYVTSPGTIGKYTFFRIRRGKPPRRSDACVTYGAQQPVRCPA